MFWQESHGKRLTGLPRALVSPKAVQKASFHSYARICTPSAALPGATTHALSSTLAQVNWPE